MTGIFDLPGIPEALNNILFGGTNLNGVEILLVSFVTLCFMLPAMITKQKPDTMVALIIFAILLCLGFGWLNIVYGSIMCIMIAILYAGAFRRMVAG